MWAAIASVVSLVVVAILNVLVVATLGGPDGSPLGDVVKQAFWALQAPLAAVFLAARGERKEAEQMAEDAGGVNVLALVILYAIMIFVIMQVVSFSFGGAIFFKDWILGSLCASGHQDRCLQIPQDHVGAGATATLFGGGVLMIATAMICFGVAGYRIGWRARRFGWLGAILTPLLTALLMFGENMLSLFSFGAGGVDSLVENAGFLQLALARAAVGAIGVVPALIGWLISLRVNRPARRYAFAVARASRRPNRDASALKNEFLNVLGFSPKEHELLVRRRQGAEPPKKS